MPQNHLARSCLVYGKGLVMALAVRVQSMSKLKRSNHSSLPHTSVIEKGSFTFMGLNVEMLENNSYAQ